MSSGQGLWQEILQHPEDDTLRRIYADWLDDDGQHDRAEFVRVQLDLTGMDEDDPRREELETRERQLLARYREEWLGGIEREGILVQFERGFPARFDLNAAAFLRNGEEIFARAPVSRLVFTDLGSNLLAQQVIDSPLLDRVECLDLNGSGVGGWDVVKLFQTRPLTALRSLDLGRVPVGSHLSSLLRHPCMLRIRELSLVATGVQGNDIEALCNSPNLGSLESLWLGSNPIGGVGTQLLAAARHLPSLRRLGLSLCRIQATGARDLAQSPRLRNLIELQLAGNPLGSDGSDELTRSPFLTRLESLDLSRTSLALGGVLHALSGAPFAPHLRELSLAGNGLGPGCVEGLARGRAAPPLRFLDLSSNDLGDDGVKALASWPGLRGLRWLDLGGNRITAHGLRPLLHSPHLGPLTTLPLSQNRLGDMGAQVLARWPGLRRLRALSIDECGIADVGGRELLDAFDRFRLLGLSGNALSPHLVEAFETAKVTGRIDHLIIGDQRPA